MTDRLATEAGDEDGPPSGAVLGAPCWVSLAAHDLAATRAFYEAVLGWEFRPGGLGDGFAVAMSDGRPVAGIGAMAPTLGVATAWLPYFGVADPDDTASRVRERGGTVGVGPIPFPWAAPHCSPTAVAPPSASGPVTSYGTGADGTRRRRSGSGS